MLNVVTLLDCQLPLLNQFSGRALMIFNDIYSFFNVHSHSFLTITIFIVIVTEKFLWGVVNRVLYFIVCIVSSRKSKFLKVFFFS